MRNATVTPSPFSFLPGLVKTDRGSGLGFRVSLGVVWASVDILSMCGCAVVGRES